MQPIGIADHHDKAILFGLARCLSPGMGKILERRELLVELLQATANMGRGLADGMGDLSLAVGRYAIIEIAFTRQ